MNSWAGLSSVKVFFILSFAGICWWILVPRRAIDGAGSCRARAVRRIAPAAVAFALTSWCEAQHVTRPILARRHRATRCRLSSSTMFTPPRAQDALTLCSWSSQRSRQSHEPPIQRAHLCSAGRQSNLRNRLVIDVRCISGRTTRALRLHHQAEWVGPIGAVRRLMPQAVYCVRKKGTFSEGWGAARHQHRLAEASHSE